MAKRGEKEILFLDLAAAPDADDASADCYSEMNIILSEDVIVSPSAYATHLDNPSASVLPYSSETGTPLITRNVGREFKSTRKNGNKSLFESLAIYKKAKRGINGRCTNSDEQNKLDTNMFELCLEELWSRTTDDKKKSCTYLDSLWFSLYKEGLTKEKEDQKEKVLRWIMGKQIFTRNYVFVPIVCWRHWSLLILCHFGEKFESKTKKPCMLLLDSLGISDPKRLEPDIRRFVVDIYEARGKLVNKKTILQIPLLVPKVPQQRNGEECGIFVLYFINQFLKNAPEVFSEDGYPYFLTKNWFDSEDLESFRKDMHSYWTARNTVQDE